ncbi:MAG: hypothetical protein J6R83_00830 [Clostridia bacterium]|nr:hypothetical protein [Clostridia bacterium]
MCSDLKNSRINKVVETTLKNLSSLVDVNTVIGTPVTDSQGSTIIPISRVTMGVLTGGGEYGKLNFFKKGDDLPFSAGNGSIISLKPTGFLIKNVNDLEYKLITVGNSTYDSILEKVTDFLHNISIDGDDK